MDIKTDTSILVELTDEEIIILSKYSNINIFLEPIRKNTKKYSRYTSLLGRLEKKSILVQNNLPKISVELYKKGEIDFLLAFSIAARENKNLLESALEKCFGRKMEGILFDSYSSDDFIELLKKLEKNNGDDIVLELIFLQFKLNGIDIEKEKRNVIRNEWKHFADIKGIQKEAQEEIEKQKNKYESLFKTYQDKVIELENDVKKKQEFISMLIEKEESTSEEKKRITILNKEINCQNSNLMKELETKNNEIQEMQEKIQDSEKKVYSLVEEKWNIENESKLKSIQELNEQIEQLSKQLSELIGDRDNIEYEIIKKNIELQEISKKVEELKCEKIQRVDISNEAYTIQNNKEGDKVVSKQDYEFYYMLGERYKDVQIVRDSDDYLDYGDDNLKIVGSRMKNEALVQIFKSALENGLSPLICGFGSREIASALIAANFGEKPTIISLANGCNDILALEKFIERTNTTCFIIEDLFGRMGEQIILPILRKRMNKQIVFCCEDVANLKYLDKSFYNYIQIIGIDRVSYSRNMELKYLYAELSNEYFLDISDEGHKCVRALLDNTTYSESFKMIRGDLISYMTNMWGYKVIDAITCWIEKEMKYIITETDKIQIKNSIQINENLFPQKMLEIL